MGYEAFQDESLEELCRRAQRMADALEPDGVCITDDGITISFPAGAVGELSLSAYIDRENLPDGLLQSWAEPEAWSETE